MHGLVALSCVLGCVFLGGCGTVGEPLYPALKIPSRVTDLTAVERGDQIDINFTIPPLTTEGLALSQIGRVELRVGPSSAAPFNINTWANTATLVDVPAPAKPGPVHAAYPARAFIGKEVVAAVRIANPRGRNSEWSNVQVIPVEQPLPKPMDFKVAAVSDGVSLTWIAPGTAQFRIYRKTAEEGMPALLATVTAPNYVDRTAEFGKMYDYYVQGAHDKTESDVAGPETITPKDVFPPHVPTGLTASAGLGSIELAWDRNTEPDFKEYRVYRSEANGPFAPLAQGLEAPSYSDHTIESGQHYRYRVAAADQSGNLSQPSEPVEAVAP